MKHLITLLLAATMLSGCEQQQANNSTATAPVRPKGQVNIPGTRLYILPPPNFKVSSSFPGLERDKASAIQVMDIADGSFYTNAASFNRAGFENRGAEVLDYKDTTVNRFPAKYAYIKGEAGTKSYMVTFGDSSFCVLVSALVPIDEKDEGADQIKKSLFAMTYDKGLRVDPFATAPFVLDDRNAKFKFLKFAANMYLYTPRTPNGNEQENAPAITVMVLPNDPSTSLSAMADLMVKTLGKYGLTNPDVRNKKAVQVNGKEGIECEIYGLMQDRKALFYQLVVRGPNNSVLVQGIVPEQLPIGLKDVKEFAHTIRLK